MKLLFCRRCGDVRALRSEAWSTCHCGASGGQYHADDLNAVIDGNDALPIGFANSTFEAAIAREDDDIRQGAIRDWGHRFEAFVIPWAAPTVTRPVRCPCGNERVWATQHMVRARCSCGRSALRGTTRSGT